MDKSYLAGFFDADGYITASRNKESEERKIVCGFTNTNKELLDLMQKYIEKTFKIKSYAWRWSFSAHFLVCRKKEKKAIKHLLTLEYKGLMLLNF